MQLGDKVRVVIVEGATADSRLRLPILGQASEQRHLQSPPVRRRWRLDIIIAYPKLLIICEVSHHLRSICQACRIQDKKPLIYCHLNKNKIITFVKQNFSTIFQFLLNGFKKNLNLPKFLEIYCSGNLPLQKFTKVGSLLNVLS